MSVHSHFINMNIVSNTLLAGRAVHALSRLFLDPTQLDAVFRIADQLEQTKAVQAIASALYQDAAHHNAFERRPRLGRVDLQALARLPEGTLGRSFAENMATRGLNPDAIELPEDDGSPAGWAFAHLRETHDIWHTVTGFDVDVAGELGLQAFYLAQFDAKLAAVLLSLGILQTALREPQMRIPRMDAIAGGWLMGRRAKPLFGFDWAAYWTTQLVDVRAMLDITALDASAIAHRA